LVEPADTRQRIDGSQVVLVETAGAGHGSGVGAGGLDALEHLRLRSGRIQPGQTDGNGLVQPESRVLVGLALGRSTEVVDRATPLGPGEACV